MDFALADWASNLVFGIRAEKSMHQLVFTVPVSVLLARSESTFQQRIRVFTGTYEFTYLFSNRYRPCQPKLASLFGSPIVPTQLC